MRSLKIRVICVRIISSILSSVDVLEQCLHIEVKSAVIFGAIIGISFYALGFAEDRKYDMFLTQDLTVELYVCLQSRQFT